MSEKKPRRPLLAPGCFVASSVAPGITRPLTKAGSAHAPEHWLTRTAARIRERLWRRIGGVHLRRDVRRPVEVGAGGIVGACDDASMNAVLHLDHASWQYGSTRSPNSRMACMILSCGGPPECAWRRRSRKVLAPVAFCQRWNSRTHVSGSPRIRRSGASVSSVNSEPAERFLNSARRFSQ